MSQEAWNSCLFDCTTMHERVSPKKYRFKNRLFEFYLDLDELDALHQKMPGFSYNRPNIYSFYDDDHFPGYQGSIKQRITTYLQENNYELGAGKVFLLCHLRTLGYVFNPVSFYFCYQENSQPLCAIAEVENTFYEIKQFIIPAQAEKNPVFEVTLPKLFYVSPYLAPDFKFHFVLHHPSEQLALHVHTLDETRPILLSWLKGHKKPFTWQNILYLSLKYPLMPLQVIFSIHTHAFILMLKGMPFFKKEAHPEKQLNILRPAKRRMKQTP